MIAAVGVEPRRFVRDLVLEALAPRETLTPDAWCERHLRVPEKNQPRPGPFSLRRTPYMRRWLRLLAEPKCRSLAVMCGTQLGKTQFLDSSVCWMIDQCPGQAIVAYPIDDQAIEHNMERFLPLVRESPRVAGHMLASPRDAKQAVVNFDTMSVHFLGTDSKTKRRSRPAKFLLVDEVDAHKPEWRDLLDRTKAYAGFKHVLFSSPTDEDAGIDAEFKRGSRESYWVPCPRCGHYQTLRLGRCGPRGLAAHARGALVWEDVTEESGGGVGVGGVQRTEQAAARARRTARYLCAGCGGEIDEADKPAMLAAGVWVPEGVDVGQALEWKAKSDRDGREAYVPERASFRLSSLYSMLGGATFGDMAAKYVAEGGATREFVNGWLGDPWVAMGDRLETAQVLAMCRAVDDGGYRVGEIPPWCVRLACAVDVQKSCLYVHVWGIGPFNGIGNDVALVDRRVVDRSFGAQLVELDRWLVQMETGQVRAYPFVGAAMSPMPVWDIAIDSGHFTDEVESCVRRLMRMGFDALCIKGAGNEQRHWSGVHGKLYAIDKDRDGRPDERGLHRLDLDVAYYKTAILNRVQNKTEMDDVAEDAAREGNAPLFAAGGAGGNAINLVPRVYLPARGGWDAEQFADYLTAEHRVMDRGTAKNPRPPQWLWKLRPGRSDNHDLDCAAYAIGLADYKGMRHLADHEAQRSAAAARRASEPRRAAGAAAME